MFKNKILNKKWINTGYSQRGKKRNSQAAQNCRTCFQFPIMSQRRSRAIPIERCCNKHRASARGRSRARGPYPQKHPSPLPFSGDECVANVAHILHPAEMSQCHRKPRNDRASESGGRLATPSKRIPPNICAENPIHQPWTGIACSWSSPLVYCWSLSSWLPWRRVLGRDTIAMPTRRGGAPVPETSVQR